MEKISRRSLLKGVGATAATVVAGGCERLAREAADESPAYTFLTADESAFIEPAVARLIPSDETGPGALEAGVPIFIDRQLAGRLTIQIVEPAAVQTRNLSWFMPTMPAGSDTIVRAIGMKRQTKTIPEP